MTASFGPSADEGGSINGTEARLAFDLSAGDIVTIDSRAEVVPVWSAVCLLGSGRAARIDVQRRRRLA
ncbi:MAG: hypothetical protein GWN84_12290 [Gammaproteobacteria bacterium]|nr:hypothetical protein [Gammaproteobacteria bacterium]NIR85230.1 hypothetical protein [Gammaproteobacteria bacterium]NIR91674.1 hypothetical protein [Gammaproteobacteria bacterium]